MVGVTLGRPMATRHPKPVHQMSDEGLLYVAQFQFRYYNRFNSDIFGTAVAGY